MMQPQLFNLDDDPDELHDLRTNPRYADICKQMETHLRSVCNPEAIDTMAKADQMAIINANGGVEAVVAKGGFGAISSPAQMPNTQLKGRKFLSDKNLKAQILKIVIHIC